MDTSGAEEAASRSTEDLEHLREERDRLRSEVDRLEGRPAKRRRMRGVIAAILVVLTMLSLALAVPGTWVRRTTVNADRYVATVGPLVEDPAVQEYLARTITAQVFLALGVQDRLNTALRDKVPAIAFLAGPITTSVQGFVKDQVGKLVATETFRTLWIEANRVTQNSILAILNGGGPILSTADGAVVLNLLPIVNDALGQISQLASDLLGRTITLPPIDSGEIPAEAIAKIQAATGIQLPSNFGQIVILDTSELASVQDAFTLANRLVFVLVLVFLLAFIAAMWVSARRRRTLIQITAASAAVMVIERRFAIAESGSIAQRARPENRAAAQAVVDVLKASLLRYTGWLLAIAIVVLLVALVTGPYGWAVTIRGWVRDLFGAIVGAARGADPAAAAGWVAAHRDALLLAGAAVFIVLLFWVSIGWLGFLLLAAVGAAYGLAVWRIAGATREDASGADSAG